MNILLTSKGICQIKTRSSFQPCASFAFTELHIYYSKKNGKEIKIAEKIYFTFRPMLHLCKNQVVGFYSQNV